MKDKLKQFVQEHRQEFEFDEAPDFVWQNIEKELKSKNRKQQLNTTTSNVIKMVLKIAAVFVLFFFVAGAWKQSHKSSETLFAQKYPELMEAENHYQAMIQVKMTEVRTYEEQNNITDQGLVTSEMFELESIYQELKDELKDEVENKKVINAMIQNYRMRLEILETLLEQLNSLEKDDNLSKKDNEKYNL